MSPWKNQTERTLYEYRGDYVNLRTVAVRPDGSVCLEGYDLDDALEQFIGRDEWEGELTVAATDVPLLRERLRLAFGPLPEASGSSEGELLDLIEAGFGGRLAGMTQFGEWCREQGIPTS
jgi:hypothetical protein